MAVNFFKVVAASPSLAPSRDDSHALLMVLFALLSICAQAQELPAEDRACIIAAIGKLPRTLKVEGSRVLMSFPASKVRNKPDPYHAIVEIDASVAGRKSIFSFSCVGDTLSMVVQPLGMR
jgi:hypothetical protein